MDFAVWSNSLLKEFKITLIVNDSKDASNAHSINTISIILRLQVFQYIYRIDISALLILLLIYVITNKAVDLCKKLY